MGALTTERYLRSVEKDAASMLAVVAVMPLDEPVPTCPEWSLRDLVVHTGVVHRHKTEIVRLGLTDGSPDQPDGPGNSASADALQEWFLEGVSDLVAVFEAADLTRPTWTWCPHDHTGEWWARRMAHETVIHAADARITAGLEVTVEGELAVDGVDEILDEMMIGGPPWGTVDPTDSIVHLTAGDRVWSLRTAEFSGTSPNTGTTYEALETFVYGDGKPDATVETDSSTLDLWLWGRAELPTSARSGSDALIDHVRSIAAESTQ